MKMKLRCFLMVLSVLSLAGCGLKGPLYMPNDASPEKSSVKKTPEKTETKQEQTTTKQQQTTMKNSD